jgi:hypothetical protein
VAVVDLRPATEDRRRSDPHVQALHAEIVRHPAAAELTDAELTAALAGRPPRGPTGALPSPPVLDQSRCPNPAAATAALDWVHALAARQAEGALVDGALIQAWTAVLICASPDDDLAHMAAAQLRSLGADPPPGVPAAHWAGFPEVDATSNLFWVELTVTTSPTGAQLWVDHRPVGPSPAAIPVREGWHLVAAAGPAGRASQTVVVHANRAQTVHLPLAAAPAVASSPVAAAVSDWVSRWRASGHRPSPFEVAQLLRITGATAAIVLVPSADGGRAEVWRVPAPGQQQAALTGSGAIGEAERLVALAVLDHPVAGSERARALVGSAPTTRPRARRPRTPWWTYALIAGAAAVAGAVVVAAELADDHQEIQLRYP